MPSLAYHDFTVSFQVCCTRYDYALWVTLNRTGRGTLSCQGLMPIVAAD